MIHSNNSELYIGLMSGTSVDGIDAALVEISSVNSAKVIATQFSPFDDTLRNQINELAQTNWNKALAAPFTSSDIIVTFRKGPIVTLKGLQQP